MATYKRLDNTGLAKVWQKMKAYVASQLSDLSDMVGLDSTYDAETGEVTLTVGVMDDADTTEY